MFKKKINKQNKNYLLDAHFLEPCLQDFKVLYVLVLEVRFKLNPLQRHGIGKKHIHKLTVGSSGAKFFDFTKVGLQAVVNPCQHVMTRQIIGCHIR